MPKPMPDRMTGRSFAHLALGIGLFACLLKLAPRVAAFAGAPPIAVEEAAQAAGLAWPLVVLGAGPWIAAWWEARPVQKDNKLALYGAGLALFLGAALPT